MALMLPARRHEISRLEAFSDAVFVFALTLLVYFLMGPAHWMQGVRAVHRRKALDARIAGAAPRPA